MIKKAKTYLNDYVISRRWFMLTVHGITVVVLITAGLFTIFDWVSRLDFFVAGLVTALGLQNAMQSQRPNQQNSSLKRRAQKRRPRDRGRSTTDRLVRG